MSFPTKEAEYSGLVGSNKWRITFTMYWRPLVPELSCLRGRVWKGGVGGWCVGGMYVYELCVSENVIRNHTNKVYPAYSGQRLLATIESDLITRTCTFHNWLVYTS